MAGKSNFNGFPRECVQFYSDLVRNNSRTWFSEHKDEFNKYVLDPAQDFVFEMGKLLKKLSPKIIADPRLDKSIFRPYRDTRFSKDKSPYKTHLGIFFWEGNRRKMECPGYYFHLEPPTLFLAAGMHLFPKPILETYRDSVVDPKYGKELVKAVKQVVKKPNNTVGGKYYKKIPRGYDAAHENAELLLHNGFYAMTEAEIPSEFYSDEILDYCFKRFKDLSPVHEWLAEMVNRTTK
ncbi:MAG: DUF2461 domain-containing protein [Desulfomonile tiedjei]|nr:DUF2461 domain-containing protein [Desulfomonile tiedjei]